MQATASTSCRCSTVVSAHRGAVGRNASLRARLVGSPSSSRRALLATIRTQRGDLHRALAKQEEQEDEPSGAYVETTTSFDAPPEKDFWEGDTWEWLGGAMLYGTVAIALLGIGIGVFAAQTYNNGATVFLKSATSDESSARLIDSSLLAPPLSD